MFVTHHRLSFVYNMLLSLFAITGALILVISSNALSLDSSAHLARHQHIAARRSAVERAPVSARCKKRGSTSSTSSLVSAPSPSSSQASKPSPSPSPSPSSGSGKVGLAWAYGDDPALKNFITDKVSKFVDFFLFPLSFLYLLSPDFTLGTLLNQQILLDWIMLQCYGAWTYSLNSRILSSPVMQILLCRSTSESILKK